MTTPQTIVITDCDILDYIARHGRLATRDELNTKMGALWQKYKECYLIYGGVSVSLHPISEGVIWAYCSDAEGLLVYRAVDV